MNRKTVVSTIALALVMTALPASSAAAAKAKRCGSKNEVRKLVKRNSWSCAKAFRYARSVPDRKYAPTTPESGRRGFATASTGATPTSCPLRTTGLTYS